MTKALNFILQQQHTATNIPHGDVVGWRVHDNKHDKYKKPLKLIFWTMKEE